MINLLPPDSKRSIAYARRNTQLLHSCLALAGVIAGTVLLIGFGHFYLSTSTARYKEDAATLQASLQAQNIDETKTRIQELSGSVNLVLEVLSREILFSKLLLQAGSVMPDGSSLSSLEISEDQKGIDITAGAINYEVGTQVHINLSDPNNRLFEKVDLVSVQCNEQSTGPYKCITRLRALFGDNSPYLFINQEPGS